MTDHNRAAAPLDPIPSGDGRDLADVLREIIDRKPDPAAQTLRMLARLVRCPTCQELCQPESIGPDGSCCSR